ITLVLLGIIRVLIPSIFPKAFSNEKWTLRKEIVTDLLFVILNSVAFVFFARFVGKIPVTFHVVIMIVIISVAAAVTLVVINNFHFLRKQVRELTGPATVTEEESPAEENSEIEFESENKSEYFHVFTEQIILVKSANNYVEVVYKTDDKVTKKLIRNTLKSTEELLSKYPQMIRCHRSYIVNKNYIQKVKKGTDGLILNMFDYAPEIHVSRQYVLKVKEALKAN
ncbi:MAG: LytTR family DNA-binding domain-containing protein, partial [Bacteroidota bacterium]